MKIKNQLLDGLFDHQKDKSEKLSKEEQIDIVQKLLKSVDLLQELLKCTLMN